MSKILVVDDEKSLRALYKKDLELEGHVVVTAESGTEAYRAFESEAPDLVVLDIRLEDDGLVTMAKMLGARREVPIVLNSGYVSYRDSFRSWAADAFLVKSSDTGELRTKIRELLSPAPRAVPTRSMTARVVSSTQPSGGIR